MCNRHHASVVTWSARNVGGRLKFLCSGDISSTWHMPLKMEKKKKVVCCLLWHCGYDSSSRLTGFSIYGVHSNLCIFVVGGVVLVLTLLVGWLEEHPACKKFEWCGVWHGYWIGPVTTPNADDLHLVQLMSLPPCDVISCFIKIRYGLPFWCQLTRLSWKKGR